MPTTPTGLPPPENLTIKRLLAVLDIRTNPPLAGDALARGRQYLVARLSTDARYELLPESELRAVAQGTKAESYRECYDEACQVALGKELAANAILVGDLFPLGSRCVLNLRVIDLATATVVEAGTAMADGPCGSEALSVLLDGALLDIGASPKAVIPGRKPPRTSESRTDEPEDLYSNKERVTFCRSLLSEHEDPQLWVFATFSFRHRQPMEWMDYKACTRGHTFQELSMVEIRNCSFKSQDKPGESMIQACLLLLSDRKLSCKRFADRDLLPYQRTISSGGGNCCEETTSICEQINIRRQVVLDPD